LLIKIIGTARDFQFECIEINAPKRTIWTTCASKVQQPQYRQFTLAFSTGANSGNRQTDFISGAVGDITKLPDKTYQQWKRNLITNLNYGFVAESHSPHQYMVVICLFNSQMYIPPYMRRWQPGILTKLS